MNIYIDHAKEVLDQFYGDEYEENIHLYETDILLEKLEGIKENIHRWYPLAHTKEYGLSPEYVRLVNVIIKLRNASKCMHDVMGLIYDMRSTTTRLDIK